jgi:hypothetical protein
MLVVDVFPQNAPIHQKIHKDTDGSRIHIREGSRTIEFPVRTRRKGLTPFDT